MKVLKRIISINELIEVKYPRYDMGKISGLDKDIEYYTINENIPIFNPLTQYITFLNYTLLDELDDNYPDLKKAVKNYVINDIVVPVDEKEQRLKNVESIIEILAKEKKDRTVADEAKLTEVIEKIKTI